MPLEPAKPSAPVRVQYQESADFLMEAFEQVPQQRVLKPRDYIVWILIVGSIFLLTVMKSALQGGGINWTRLAWIWGPIFLAFGSFLYFLSRFGRSHGPISRRWYRSIYQKRTGREVTQVTCEFGDAAFFVSAEGGVASHYPWGVIQRVVQTPKGLLIYQAPETFHWFPKRVFTSEADYTAVVHLVRSKVANFETKD